MLSTGIDDQKRYSMLSTVDAEGNRVREARVEANSAEGFRRYFGALGEPIQVVLEACWNWAKLHEVLEEIEGVGEVVLAHPYKTRLIGEAQIQAIKANARGFRTFESYRTRILFFLGKLEMSPFTTH